MKPFSIFSWNNLWTSCGLIALLATIWFSGPLISIADYKPLESIWVRIILSCVIIFTVIAIKSYQWYITKKLNQNVLEELKASEITNNTSMQSSLLAERFADVDLVLQRHSKKHTNPILGKWFRDQKDYIYQKPWFLLIGASGVGKTSSILNAGLTFPVEVSDDISKLAGTQDCDWFLTDEALFLDTAGRFIEQNDDQQSTEDWQELLSLIKRCRTKQPINGLILMLSVEDIINNDENKIKKQLHQIRLRLQELNKTLKTTFPLYIIINKTDLIAGFQQFFQHLNEDERKKALGLSLDTLNMTNAEKMNKITATLDTMSEYFQKHLFYSVVSNNQNNEATDIALLFPSEFKKFTYVLNIYLKKLLNISQYDLDLNLAGIYFSSIQQTTDKLLISEEMSTFSLKEKYRDVIPEVISTPYFVNTIFNTILINSSDLAGVDKVWLRKNKLYYWSGFIGLSLFIILFLFAIYKSYQHNQSKFEQISSQISMSEEYLQHVTSEQLDSILESIQQVFDLEQMNKQYQADLKWKDLRLAEFSNLEKASHEKYNIFIDDYIIPFISNEIDDQLKRSIESQNYELIYRNLKAYLMLYEDEHYQEEFISQWISNDLLPYSKLINAQSDAQKKVLQQILTNKRIISKKTYDADLVNHARQILAQQEFSVLIYNNLNTYVQTLDSKSLPMVSFTSMGGSSTSTLFRRIGEKTLSDPINILYTKYGYEHIFVSYINMQLEQFYHHEKWVMGNKTFVKTEQQTLSELYQMYSTDYISNWQSYIKEIQMLQPKDLQQAIVMSKQLSEKNSSLVNIIRNISENTQLHLIKINPTVNQVTEQSLTKTINSTEQVKSYIVDHSQMQGYLQEIASHFTPLHSLTQHNDGSASQLDEIVSAINNLYIYLVALQMSMQNNDQLLPDNKPVIYYKAQVSRLPEPFKPMLDIFVNQIGETNKAYLEQQKQQQLLIQEQEKQQQLLAQQQQLTELVKAYDYQIKQECLKNTKNRYPFDVKAEQDASIQALHTLFGKDGKYMQSSTMDVSVQANKKIPYKLALADIDAQRILHYEQAELLSQRYFLDDKQPYIDFTVKIIAMDKMIDKLNFTYGDKVMNYYHGPHKSIHVEWPNKNNNIRLNVYLKDKKNYQLESNGDWSLFRFLDKAEKVIPTADGKGILATFILNKQKIHIEFKSTSKNVFKLNDFRDFVC